MCTLSLGAHVGICAKLHCVKLSCQVLNGKTGVKSSLYAKRHLWRKIFPLGIKAIFTLIYVRPSQLLMILNLKAILCGRTSSCTHIDLHIGILNSMVIRYSYMINKSQKASCGRTQFCKQKFNITAWFATISLNALSYRCTQLSNNNYT